VTMVTEKAENMRSIISEETESIEFYLVMSSIYINRQCSKKTRSIVSRFLNPPKHQNVCKESRLALSLSNSIYIYIWAIH
jgi:hypothetical protein